MPFLLFNFGKLAVKIGLKKIFITGLFIFSIVYGGIAYAYQSFHFYILFFLYGIYATATDGISKAWITNISSKEDTAAAIGIYVAFQSICTMLASSLAGFVWVQFGEAATFFLSAVSLLVVTLYIAFIREKLTSDNLENN